MTIQENISQAACRLLHVASDGLRGNSCEPGNFRCIVATLGLWWVIQGWRGCLNVFLEKKIISNHRFQIYLNKNIICLVLSSCCGIAFRLLIPGSSKKTAIAPDKLLKFIDPLLPPLQSCNWTGWTYLTWMAVFSEGRWRQPEGNNFEVGGKGESHAWIYISIGWLFFMKNPVWGVF